MVFANPFDKARMKVDNAFSSTRTALEQARTVGEKALTAAGTSPPNRNLMLRSPSIDRGVSPTKPQ